MRFVESCPFRKTVPNENGAILTPCRRSEKQQHNRGLRFADVKETHTDLSSDG